MTFKQFTVALFSASCLQFSCSNAKMNENTTEKNSFVNTSPPIATGILKPCRWSFTVEQNEKGEAYLISTATLDSGWHLYSQHIPKKEIATVFTYTPSENYQLSGDTEEGKVMKEYNPYLETEILYFEKQTVFKQKINVLSKRDFIVQGTIEYLACLTVCVDSDEEFMFEVKGISGK